jgi:hypothetical protein
MVIEAAFMLHDQAMHDFAGDSEPTSVLFPKMDQISVLEMAMAEAFEQWKSTDANGRRQLTGAQYFPMRNQLQDELAELQRERAEFESVVNVAPANKTLSEVRADWELVSLERQQAFIHKYISAVTVHPIPVTTTKSGRTVKSNRFDPTLIEIEAA